MKIMIIIITFVLILSPVSAQAGAVGFADSQLISNLAPEVRIVKPSNDEVQVENSGSVEFKWSPFDGSSSDREYYDFRLYKGYNMVESTLILKKSLAADVYQITIEAAVFEDGQAYTCSIKQVYRNGQKSRRTYQSFKIIKK